MRRDDVEYLTVNNTISLQLSQVSGNHALGYRWNKPSKLIKAFRPRLKMKQDQRFPFATNYL